MRLHAINQFIAVRWATALSVAVLLLGYPINGSAMDLDTADASFLGEHAGDTAGDVLSIVGDVDLDGFDDIVVGAMHCDQAGADAGKLYLVMGRETGWFLDAPLGAAHASFLGEEPDARTGCAISMAGDIDSDGYGDFLVGARGIDDGGNDRGRAYLFLGPGSLWTQEDDMSSAYRSWTGIQDNEELGAAVAIVGDVNGDDFDDLLLGAPQNDDGGQSSGKTYLVLGHVLGGSGDTPVSDADASWMGENSNAFSGGALCGAGDVDGDGYDDFLIGNDTIGGAFLGVVHLILGRPGGWAHDVDLSLADASFVSEHQPDNAGWAIAGPGDLDGDGSADLLVGAPHNQEMGADSGQVYVLLDGLGNWSYGMDLANASASFVPNDGGDTLGWSVAGLGDLNGDGYSDLAIGAPGAGTADAGQTYLFLGDAGAWGMDTPYLGADRIFDGMGAGDGAGAAVAGVGDLDGDGLDDLLIGAPGNDEAALDAGKIYVVLGTECIDTDGDGFDQPGHPSCPGGAAEDCDDHDPDRHPGAAEICDGKDNDCDGTLPMDESTDADGDGFVLCSDCDDGAPTVYPGAFEACDGQDSDCDGLLPIWDADHDEDGWSICAGDCDDADASLHLDDLDGDGFSPCEGDCDDTDAGLHPGAKETCDGLDSDCDGVLPDSEQDLDGDGFSTCAGDCDDEDEAVHPDAAELCNGIDDDCDGVTDDVDADGDGYVAEDCGGEDCDDALGTVHPGVAEVCDDDLDNDCDGDQDEADDECIGDDDTGDDDDSTPPEQGNDPPPAEEGDLDDGCACRLSKEGTPGPWGLLMLLGGGALGLWRVRRGRFRRHRSRRGVSAISTPGFVVLLAALGPIQLLTGCSAQNGDDDSAAHLGDDDDDELGPGGLIEGSELVDFGPVPVGTEVEFMAEIRNEGVQPLVVSDVIVAGLDEALFETDFVQPVTIASDPHIYMPLTIRFSPESAAPANATVIVVSSAVNVGLGNPFAIALYGHGVEDLDGDGYPAGEGYDGENADCDDGDPAIHPGVAEDCNGVDDDCDGQVDNIPDADGDGASLCDEFPDCDDEDPTTHPVWVDPAAVGGFGTSDEPFSSLDDAFAVEHCGAVLLRAGTYREGHLVEVATGSVEVISIDGPGAAILDGTGGHGLLAFDGGPVTIRGLRFLDGMEVEGAGALLVDGDLRLESCSFEYNRSELGAGAVHVRGAEVRIENTAFLLNQGNEGGALLVDQSEIAGSSEIASSWFIGNEATVAGGGTLVRGGNATIRDTTFVLNTAPVAAGLALEALESGWVEQVQLHDNVAPIGMGSAGGGMAVIDSFSVEIVSTSVLGNTADVGGGIAWYRAAGTLMDSTIQGNDAGELAGGVYVGQAYLEVTGTTLSANQALEAGGALYADEESLVVLRRSRFLENTADAGGAAFLRDSQALLANDVFDANEGTGAAVWASAASLAIEQCTFFDNQAPSGSGTIDVEGDPAGLVVTASIFADGGPNALACSGLPGGWDYTNAYHSQGLPSFSPECLTGGIGLLEEDPMFHVATVNLDATDDDLRLQQASPCVDAGAPTCSEPDGTVCDLGAFGGSDPI